VALFPWGKKKDVALSEKQALVQVPDRTWTQIFDWMPGRWQQDSPLDTADSVISNPIVYACISRLASDLGKMVPTTQTFDPENRLWTPKNMPRFVDLLLTPNSYQSHLEFKEAWMYSKLIHGNTYVLSEVDPTGKVTGLHVLDPSRVMPLVSPDGEVFYRLDADNLAKLGDDQIVVPGSFIMHDRMNAYFHPLVGLSPLYAATIAAKQGLAIQNDSRKFFENGSQPSGVLVAPGPIDEGTAIRLKEYWKAKFTGDNAGNIAVLGDGMKYESMRMSSVDAQMISQLDWTAETICSVFAVPPHMVGVGDLPGYDNVEAVTQSYYSNGLQIHVEKFENVVGVGLQVPAGSRIELDLTSLFRMDSTRQMDYLTKGVNGTLFTPNEGRRRLNLPPIEGGDTVYLQQQNFSLEALAERDKENPLGAPPPAPPAPPSTEEPEEDEESEEEEMERAMETSATIFDNLTKAIPLGVNI